MYSAHFYKVLYAVISILLDNITCVLTEAEEFFNGGGKCPKC